MSWCSLTLALLLAAYARARAAHLLQGRPLQALPHRALYAGQIPEQFAYSGALYQPSLYASYDTPYPYGVTPATAVVELKGEGEVQGTLLLVQPHPPSGPVFLSGNITGLAPGKHGFHVHTYGDLRDGCKSAGSHYNPYQTGHGGPVDPFRHIGDLGNIVANDGGVATVQMSDHAISLAGPLSVVGRSIVVHEKEDDLGRGGDQESLKTGNAGGRLACGVVAVAAEPPPVTPSAQQ